MSTAPDPQVTVRQGILSGKYMHSRNGRIFCAFQGIPYAKPPVEELRFQAPQEPVSWTGIREAKKEGSKCPQFDIYTGNTYKGDEDCLYLNVFTPSVTRKDAGFSVLVWIHGGGFTSGSGNTEFFGPELLLDHDVILVTFNYRLGALGFLNLGTKDAPGNYGLKDQVAVLRWIQRNIANFGGNPGSVTVFGESAGGACVHYLLLSPLARGLFHRAVVQSGSAFSDWAIQRDPVARGREFASKLLKPILTNFAPSVEPEGTDGAFLSDDPRRIVARGDVADVPVIAGCTSQEGVMFIAMVQSVGAKMSDKLNNTVDFIHSWLGLKKDSPEYNDTWDVIKSFYEQLEPVDLNERFNILRSDLDFHYGVDQLVREYAALRRSPVYLYSFSYEGTRGMMKVLLPKFKTTGAAHGQEVGYLFSRDFIPDEIKSTTPSDMTTIDNLTQLWVNFARTGNPTPDSSLALTWHPVAAPLHRPELADTYYLDIGTNLIMRNESLYAKRMAFWRKLETELKNERENIAVPSML